MIKNQKIAVAAAATLLSLGFAEAGYGQATSFTWNSTGTANSSTGVNYYSSSVTTDPTDISSAQYELGTSGSNSFTMASGSLTLVNTTYSFLQGQTSTATLDFQGGSLTVGAEGTGDEGRSFVFGNSPTGICNMTQEGGDVTMTVEGAALSGEDALGFGRDGATANFTMTGGVFSTNAALVVFGAPAAGPDDLGGGTGQGVGDLTLGEGNEVFELTDASSIFFGTTGSYINFDAGTDGSVELFNGGTAGSTLTNFDSYVAADNILLNGAATTAAAFTETTNGSEDVYTLTAAVPEPSTWAMGLAGFGMLGWLQRFRRARRA
jgi:hypothetical protein